MTVSRKSAAGEVYKDLRNLSRTQGKPFNELLVLHALDGFLARLAASNQGDRLILKGGVLLAALDLRRATRDVDLQAQDVSNDADTVLELVCRIADTTFPDGLTFDTSAARAEIIRDDEDYSGVRISLTAHLATADVPFHVDINVGDPISPAPTQIVLPRVLGEPVALRGYPIPMVCAEKIVTAVRRGTVNTRWRDFGDVYALAGRHPISGDDLIEALVAVSTHRRVELRPLEEVLATYAELSQSKYAAWQRKHSRVDLPSSLQDVLVRVFAVSDPALMGEVSGWLWSPSLLAWS